MPISFKPRLFTGPPAYVAQTGWGPLLAIAASVAMLVAATVGASLLLLLLHAAFAPSGEMGSLGGTGLKDLAAIETPDQLRRFIIYLLLFQAVLILLTLRAAGMFGAHPRSALALGPALGSWPVYVESVLGMIGVLVATNLAVSFFNPGGMTSDLKPFVGLIKSENWWLALLAIGIGAPVSEELLFRGFLFSALAKSRAGVAGAAALTTTAWTALHAGYSVSGMFEVGLIGLYFSWLLWRSGSLRVPLFCHGLYNTTVFLALAVVPLSPSS